MTATLNECTTNEREQQFPLYSQYLNHQLVSVLKTLGFDKTYVRAENQYLYDQQGQRYLDLLSGYGVHSIGRNHPKVKAALHQAIDADTANMVQLDAPWLAACFAQKLAPFMPEGVNKFFFANSGTEAIEGAIKFARAATKRSKLLHCHNSFHGLTNGSLSLNGGDSFKKQFQPLLPGVESIPFNDLEALEQALATKQFACFVLEPIQGKGVYIPSDNYFTEVSVLCKKYKTLLVLDEVQSGIGRTGQFFAYQHWQDVEPDIITMAKALSGGFIPVGVIAMREWIFNKVYRNMETAVVHSCTFGRNDLAMTAGIATLEVIQQEDLINKAAQMGQQLIRRLSETLAPFEMVKEVRGKGMMIGIEFCPPKSLKLKAGWKLLEAANKGLFCQLIIIPLFERYRMLTQVAGPNSYVIKLLPPLTISQQDVDDVVAAFEDIIKDAHQLGAIWNLGKTLAKHALTARKDG